MKKKLFTSICKIIRKFFSPLSKHRKIAWLMRQSHPWVTRGCSEFTSERKIFMTFDLKNFFTPNQVKLINQSNIVLCSAQSVITIWHLTFHNLFFSFLTHRLTHGVFYLGWRVFESVWFCTGSWQQGGTAGWDTQDQLMEAEIEIANWSMTTDTGRGIVENDWVEGEGGHDFCRENLKILSKNDLRIALEC